MSTITYNCDTCKRQIELLENKTGLTNQNFCIITNNCKGNLYIVKRNPNNVRETLPDFDPNLENYVQRKLLYIHTQTVANTQWIVNHGFGDSTVFIVYNFTGTILDVPTYNVSKISAGISLVTFTNPTAGIAHVLTRTGGATIITNIVEAFDIQLTNNGILTFAIPKYITRVDSSASPILPPPLITPTPTPTATALPAQSPVPTPPFNELYSPCNKIVRIEIEIQKPNEPALTCTETFDVNVSPISAWATWNEILVKNRKHYCIKTKTIANLKIFANTNKQNFIIPDGTTFKILRIDYGTGLLTTIPDKGLLLLLTDNSGTTPVRILDKIIDCGQLVDTPTGYFNFMDDDLFSIDDLVETSYPNIKKYS